MYVYIFDLILIASSLRVDDSESFGNLAAALHQQVARLTPRAGVQPGRVHTTTCETAQLDPVGGICGQVLQDNLQRELFKFRDSNIQTHLQYT